MGCKIIVSDAVARWVCRVRARSQRLCGAGQLELWNDPLISIRRLRWGAGGLFYGVAGSVYLTPDPKISLCGYTERQESFIIIPMVTI